MNLLLQKWESVQNCLPDNASFMGIIARYFSPFVQIMGFLNIGKIQEDIAGTSTCFALKLLDLSHNNLHSVSHVVDSLRSLRKLQRITIKENFEEYSELLPASTSVKILDGKVIVNVSLFNLSTLCKCKFVQSKHTL